MGAVKTLSGKKLRCWINFDGLSIMYGSPRRHIWMYVAGFTSSDVGWFSCPCNNGSANQPPPFIGSDYYCESGNPNRCLPILLHNDPLWDGQQCVGGEATCCTHPNMPWFLKTLNETTTEDIELKACTTKYGLSW